MAKKKSNTTSSAIFDLKLIQEYSDFMQKNALTEIDIQWGEKSLRLKKGSPAVSHAQVAMPQVSAATMSAPVVSATPTSNGNGSAQKKTHVVTSPFVGTFYRSPGPNQESFVDEGKTVHAGDTLCIVEAMKLMNEIESEIKGRVVRSLIPDGTPVEFGEALFEIEPI